MSPAAGPTRRWDPTGCRPTDLDDSRAATLPAAPFQLWDADRRRARATRSRPTAMAAAPPSAGRMSTPVRARRALVAVAGAAAVVPPAAAVTARGAVVVGALAAAMAAFNRAVAAGVKSKLNTVTLPSWMVSCQVESSDASPRLRNRSRATVPENVTTSGVTATGLVISAWKLPAASSCCQLRIPARVANTPVGRLTTAPGANMSTTAFTLWAFSLAINVRATVTASGVCADAGGTASPANTTTAGIKASKRLITAPLQFFRRRALANTGLRRPSMTLAAYGRGMDRLAGLPSDVAGALRVAPTEEKAQLELVLQWTDLEGARARVAERIRVRVLTWDPLGWMGERSAGLAAAVQGSGSGYSITLFVGAWALDHPVTGTVAGDLGALATSIVKVGAVNEAHLVSGEYADLAAEGLVAPLLGAVAPDVAAAVPAVALVAGWSPIDEPTVLMVAEAELGSIDLDLTPQPLSAPDAPEAGC